MKIDEKLVILSSDKGGKNHLKIRAEKDLKRATFTLGKSAKSSDAYIVFFGNEITKQALYKDKTEYKVRFGAYKQIDVLLVDGDETYVGSTGPTPKVDQLKDRLTRYENSQIQDEIVEENHAPEADKNGHENQEENLDKNEADKGADFDKNEANTGADFDKKTATFDIEKEDESRAECCQETTTFTTKNEQDGPVQSDRSKEGIDDEASGFMFDEIHFDGSNFYLSVKPQIDELFVCYPESEELNFAVPNSRWVQVEAVDGYYVVGLVYDCDTVAYICYGVPSKEMKTPPDEIKNLCVWLPISAEKGYWIIYQDAMTGKCLK